MKLATKDTWRGLTTEEWESLAPLIPAPMRQGAQKKITDRQMVDALLHREYTKLPWSKLPGLEKDHLAVVKRYTRWRDNGTLQRVFEELDRMGLLPEAPPEPEPAAEEAWKAPEWWELTDWQWEQVSGLLPPDQEEKQQNGRYKTNRQILNILLYREYTDTAWRELPKEFGPWRTVYVRYSNWKEQGIAERVFGELDRLGVLSEDKYQYAQQSVSGDGTALDWWEVTDEQWQQLSPLLRSKELDKRGKKIRNDRRMLNAILCRFRTKTIWVELPEKYGSWRTVIERYRKWRDDGTLQLIFDELELMLPVLEDELEGPVKKEREEPERPLWWWELTDEEWSLVADLLPLEQVHKSCRYKTNRQILNALLYREYTNTAWRNIPKEYISWRTLFERYSQWKNSGVLQQVFAKLKHSGVITEEKYRQGRSSIQESSLEWWELTDQQWERLRPIFPKQDPSKRGRRAGNDRQMLNAILCRYHTDAAWLELPRKYGPWRTVVERYRKWRDEGVLDRVFAELKE